MLPRFSIFLISAVFLLDALFNGHPGRADVQAPAGIEVGLKQELAKRYVGARVELGAPIQWMHRLGTAAVEPAETSRITSIIEGPLGDVRLTVLDEDGTYYEGVTQFTATQPVWVATRRIYPGEKLMKELFSIQDVDVAHGMARDYRGILLTPANFKEADFIAAESRQTILEGQFLSSTSVQRSPDIRRGDAVTIMIQTGGLKLSTAGTAQESGYLNGQIRVLTNNTKRELLGSLKPGGLVEVRL